MVPPNFILIHINAVSRNLLLLVHKFNSKTTFTYPTHKLSPNACSLKNWYKLLLLVIALNLVYQRKSKNSNHFEKLVVLFLTLLYDD